MKKCKSCGAPLEGFLYNTIGKLMGVKPSENDPEMCNKCAAEGAKPAAEESTAEAAPAPEMASPEAPAQEPAQEPAMEPEAPAQEPAQEPAMEPEAPAQEAPETEEEKTEQNI